MVEGAALEMLCRATYRGFESHLLRNQKLQPIVGWSFFGPWWRSSYFPVFVGAVLVGAGGVVVGLGVVGVTIGVGVDFGAETWGIGSE